MIFATIPYRQINRGTIIKRSRRCWSTARKMKDGKFKAKLVAKWFANPWPSFFTTRRILLGNDAEDWLTNKKFSG